MSRHDRERLEDIVVATEAITGHLGRGSLDDGLVFDAVRVRLIEIGEAVKGIDPELLAEEPAIPWNDVAGMRDQLAHRYFDAAHSIVAATIDHDLPPLVAAVQRLLDNLDPTG
ncbi:MAG: DUF86 domain-containing protein [Acidimicrobiia bacterium]|nr:DUF86 domain-containing protein [Acidimicrobiia bacterium]